MNNSQADGTFNFSNYPRKAVPFNTVIRAFDFLFPGRRFQNPLLLEDFDDFVQKKFQESHRVVMDYTPGINNDFCEFVHRHQLFDIGRQTAEITPDCNLRTTPDYNYIKSRDYGWR